MSRELGWPRLQSADRESRALRIALVSLREGQMVQGCLRLLHVRPRADHQLLDGPGGCRRRSIESLHGLHREDGHSRVSRWSLRLRGER